MIGHEVLLLKGTKAIKLARCKSVSEELLGSKAACKQLRETCWQKRPLVVRGSPSRVEHIIEEFMHNLDIQSLLANTCSDAVHIWLKGRDASTLDSISVPQPDQAHKLHKAGHSLYCRAPPELEQAIVPRLLAELGLGVGGSESDKFRRGEIETFFSRAGHTTEFHTDFQENFTVQLSGVKRWTFKSSSAAAPLRGCTPHFGTSSGSQVVETQLKALRLGDAGFSALQVSEDGGSCSVDLTPGDVLYHPAGVWHRVECLEDSVAINVSLVGASLAEVVCSALQQLLWEDRALRAPAAVSSGGDAAEAQAALAKAAHALEAATAALRRLEPRDLLPPSCFTAVGGSPDVESEEEDEEDEEEEEDDSSAPKEAVIEATKLGPLPSSFRLARQFRLNPLAVIVAEAALVANGWGPSSVSLRAHLPADDVVFVVHINFGNEQLESLSRSVVSLPAGRAWVVPTVQRFRHQPGGVFNLHELLAQAQGAGTGAGVGKKRKKGGDEQELLPVLESLYALAQAGVLSAN